MASTPLATHAIRPDTIPSRLRTAYNSRYDTQCRGRTPVAVVRLTFQHTHAMAKNFESEITKFLKEYKKTNPDVEARQREGRGRLWDKHLDPEVYEGFRAARVPQDPYVYYQK